MTYKTPNRIEVANSALAAIIADRARPCPPTPPPGPARGWMDRAACAGLPTEMAFPSQIGKGALKHARYFIDRCCGTCPVVADCGAYADDTADAVGKHGVWGGRYYRMGMEVTV